MERLLISADRYRHDSTAEMLTAPQMVERCLAKLEAARQLVESAAADICPIRELGDEWSKYHHVASTLQRYQRLIGDRRDDVESAGCLTLDR